MTVLEVLRRLAELLANWEVLRAVLDAIAAFSRGEVVPVVITWERKRLVITVQLLDTDLTTTTTTLTSRRVSV